MPFSKSANHKEVVVPWSEAATVAGIAGKTMLAIEEDQYANKRMIPADEPRRGCFVAVNGDAGGALVPFLKSEVGWDDEDGVRRFMVRSRDTGHSFVRAQNAEGEERVLAGHVRFWLAESKEAVRTLVGLYFPDETILFVREVWR